jgi:hypothetical protein
MKMKPVWPVYVLLTFAILVGFAWVKSHVSGPEQMIAGTWHELSWEYEKVNTPADKQRLKDGDTIAQSVKDQLGKHLMIHSAETWKFQPDGTLILEGRHAVKIIRWKLKGRGHILELEHRDHTVEHYNLTALTREKMILNFDSDMQVKGIAKLTFHR